MDTAIGLEIVKGVFALLTGGVTGWFGYQQFVLKAKKEKESIEAKKPKYDVKAALKLTNTINAELLNLLQGTASDRATVGLFHNGGKYFTGEPMQKVTIAFEKCHKNTRRIARDYQAMPVSLYSHLLTPLLDKDFNQIHISDLGIDENTKKMVRYNKSKSTYIFNIYDMNTEWIGVLMIEYIREECRLDDQKIDLIQRSVYRAGVMLQDWDKCIDIELNKN